MNTVHDFKYEEDIKLVLERMRITITEVLNFQDTNILVYDKGGN